VVLTDGSLHDEKPTRDLLVEMSYLPVSVIVVGIGQTDFKLMNQFNYERLTNSIGKEAARTMTQFIHCDSNEDLLVGVPQHFVDYVMLQ
jgi:hypothetical protein